eukprot:scaffold126364_cov28-Tisochrysis_lutea.AAC.2
MRPQCPCASPPRQMCELKYLHSCLSIGTAGGQSCATSALKSLAESLALDDAACVMIGAICVPLRGGALAVTPVGSELADVGVLSRAGAAPVSSTSEVPAELRREWDVTSRRLGASRFNGSAASIAVNGRTEARRPSARRYAEAVRSDRAHHPEANCDVSDRKLEQLGTGGRPRPRNLAAHVGTEGGAVDARRKHRAFSAPPLMAKHRFAERERRRIGVVEQLLDPHCHRELKEPSQRDCRDDGRQSGTRCPAEQGEDAAAVLRLCALRAQHAAHSK